MLRAVEGELCLLDELDELEMMLCILLCMQEDVERRLCSLEVMRCMLLRMLDAVEGGLSFKVSTFPLWQFSRCGPPPIKQGWLYRALVAGADRFECGRAFGQRDAGTW